MFRKILLPILFTSLFLLELNAQTEKGTFLIGTDFQLKNLGYNKRGDFTFKKYNAGLRTGYFIKDNWLIGGDYAFNYTSSRNSTNLGYTAESYSAGLFARKYFDTKFPQWKPFVELGSGYNHYSFQHNSSAPSDIPPKFSSSGGYGRAEAGIAYFFKENISLNLSGYTQMNFSEGATNTNGGLKIGVNFYLGGKKKD